MRVLVVGGGPSGATTAHELALRGVPVTLLERNLCNDKSCAGGIPAKLITDFQIPDPIIESIATNIHFVAPTKRETKITVPRELGIGTVKRKVFDAFLRDRAAGVGAELIEADFIRYEDRGASKNSPRYRVEFKTRNGQVHHQECDFLIGADGAISRVSKQALGRNLTQVVARQKFITPTPDYMEGHFRDRVDVYYTSEISPDYYGWVFPRRTDISLGVGVGYDRGRLIRPCLENLHRYNRQWLQGAVTTDINAAPIPVEQDYGRIAFDNILLVGDSAGFVLPALGEGIYYGMLAGRIAAQQIHAYAEEGAAHPVSVYPREVELTLEPLFKLFRAVQNWAYVSDFRRELFCELCKDPYYSHKILATFAMKTPKPNRNLLRKVYNYSRLTALLIKLGLMGNLRNVDYLKKLGINFEEEFAVALGQ
ncbi:MAG TPA: geranylgeranyl reductase family protein [bacterium]|nr:geranylgeranyl reductase family protein [bacterium]